MANETVTETRLEAVEHELVVCPLCEQTYDPEFMVQVVTRPHAHLNPRHPKIDVSFGKLWSAKIPDLQEAISIKAKDEAQLCPGCAENIGIVGGERVDVQTTRSATPRELSAVIAATVSFSLIGSILDVRVGVALAILGLTFAWVIKQ